MDTSAWYPVVMRSHPQHGPLAAVLQKLVAQGNQVVTTNFVVAETHVLLLRRDRRETALAFVRTVREPPNLVVASTSEIEARAISDWLEPYADQDFSFADAVSFAVMTDRGITEALTLDRHFAAAGFGIVPQG